MSGACFKCSILVNGSAGKMENILVEESFNDQTKILLVNAAYFVTNWMKKFSEEQTKECPFRINKV